MPDSKRKQFIIFGIGRFGSALARTLCELGHEVLAVDSDESRVAAIAPYVTNAVQMSTNDEESMGSLGIRNFDAVIVAIGDDLQHSLLVSIMCKELGAKYLIGKATDATHAKMLTKLGVDKIIFPERDMGIRVAHTLVNPHTLDLINLRGDHIIADIICPKEWVGKSLAELALRNRYKLSLLAIYQGQEMNMDITAATRFKQGDNLLLLGHKNDVRLVEELD